MGAKNMSTKPKRIPKRVAMVLESLQVGNKLCKSLRMKESGETEITYYYEPSGHRVGPKTAEQVIKGGYVIPAGDGLFGDETSQTWTLP